MVAYHTREALIIEAKFLRDDLPYFTELLSEVIFQTKYTGMLILSPVNYSRLMALFSA